MVTQRRITLAFVLGCLLLCCLEPLSASGNAEGEDEIIETSSSSGRHLLQNNAVCPHQWAFDNFAVLEQNCPYLVNITPTYDKKRCCEYGLGGMLCPYVSLVSDISTGCAKSFFVTLAYVAPNYTSDWFGFICTDPNSPAGIQCPANLTGNATAPSPSGSFLAGSHSFGLSLLLAVAVFEILVLLF